jgi:hypothetical protein
LKTCLVYSFIDQIFQIPGPVDHLTVIGTKLVLHGKYNSLFNFGSERQYLKLFPLVHR